MITLRSAIAADAQKIGAVFDAAIGEERKYLRELARHSMFPPEQWDKVVVEHSPPNALLVATNELDAVISPGGLRSGWISARGNSAPIDFLAPCTCASPG